MLEILSKRWWLVGLRGVLALIFGILAFIFPSDALTVLVLVFGIYALIDGIFALVAAISLKPHGNLWGSLLFEGIVGILAGIFTFLWPAMTAIALVYVVAAWAIVTGILELVAAFRMRTHISNEWLMALAGICSIILGVLLMVMPAAGLFVWVMLVAAYAVVFGIAMIGLAIRLYNLSHRPPHPSVPTTPHPA